MTDCQKITQMKEPLKGLDQRMQKFMTEVYNTIDTKLAETTIQLQNLLAETTHSMSISKQLSAQTSYVPPTSPLNKRRNTPSPKRITAKPKGKEIGSSNHIPK